MTWARAHWWSQCQTCDALVWPSQQVGRWAGQWQHRACVEAQGRVWVELAQPAGTSDGGAG